MSKKSRRRNKKILAALALAGGAAMMAKGRRNKAIDAGIAAAEADKGSDMLSSAKDYITQKANVVAPAVKSSFRPRVYPGTVLNERGSQIIDPNENNPYVRTPPGGMRRFKKGGSVTGIAKRGFGRALMKGKK
jgi:hypothetical protein